MCSATCSTTLNVSPQYHAYYNLHRIHVAPFVALLMFRGISFFLSLCTVLHPPFFSSPCVAIFYTTIHPLIQFFLYLRTWVSDYALSKVAIMCICGIVPVRYEAPYWKGLNINSRVRSGELLTNDRFLPTPPYARPYATVRSRLVLSRLLPHCYLD